MTAQQKKLRSQLIEACIAKQQILINDFKTRISSLLQVDGLGNEESYDNNEQANVSQNIAEADALNKQLSFAVDEMKELHTLESLPDVNRDSIKFGAVVKTDKKNFFISSSVEEIKVGNRTFMGLSVRSALYLEMKGLTKGDKFSYRGTTYTILEIF